jgi:hypothetical protein
MLGGKHITLRCHGVAFSPSPHIEHADGDYGRGPLRAAALRMAAAAIFLAGATVQQERNAALVSGGYANNFTNSG